ncbi:hypothetical protein [Mycobacterium sp.]|uniref:hypothetical protein n=1 Tax=Mycobacterium sp. TaxID=1785 RepID=UPI002D054C48|nr:hypothetical protein [Mycobacterium sp.]HKP40121.1 hypothetical protein [Mycobacterium sp.]
MRRIVVCVVVALATAATIATGPAQADPPQCDNGPIVLAGCPGPGVCTAVIEDQCVGVQPPLLPPPPPVRVGIEGGVGVGI